MGRGLSRGRALRRGEGWGVEDCLGSAVKQGCKEGRGGSGSGGGCSVVVFGRGSTYIPVGGGGEFEADWVGR